LILLSILSGILTDDDIDERGSGLLHRSFDGGFYGIGLFYSLAENTERIGHSGKIDVGAYEFRAQVSRYAFTAI
jgi:hypothetical protein